MIHGKPSERSATIISLSFLRFFSALTVFLFFCYPVGDADLGWHLRYGEYLLHTGRLLRENIFSSVLPNYIWVNHSWAFDPIAAFIFGHAGFIGLSLSGALLIALS